MAYKTRAALFATERRKLEKQQKTMVQEGQTLEDRKAEAAAAVAASEALHASIAAAKAALAEKEAALNARERELFGEPLGGAKQDPRAANAAEQRRALRHKPGGLLDEPQSQAILLLYFHLVEMRKSPEKSVKEVTAIFGIGNAKGYAVSTVDAFSLPPSYSGVVHNKGVSKQNRKSKMKIEMKNDWALIPVTMEMRCFHKKSEFQRNPVSYTHLTLPTKA